MAQLKRELRSASISAAVTPSLKDKVLAYKREHGVTESTAVEYIVELFFETNSIKNVVKHTGDVELSETDTIAAHKEL